MRQKAKKILSVIVPTFWQEKTIVKDIQEISDVLSQTRYDYEIIVVIDGTSRDKTFQNAKKASGGKIKVIGYPHNHGKGYAVRFGMARSKGDYVAFIDSGMDINPNGISMLLEHLEWYKADIIIGSKLHPVSKVVYPLERKIISFLARLWIWLLFGLKVKDTQAGLKIFKRSVLEKVLPRLLVKKFAFDIEILAVSKHLGFDKIYEAPIDLKYNFKSTIMTKSFLYVLLRTFMDTLAIWYRLNLLHYYEDNNQRKWKFDPELNFKVNIG